MAEPPLLSSSTPPDSADHWQIQIQEPLDRLLATLPAFSGLTGAGGSTEVALSPLGESQGMGYLALGQINATPGDLQGNAEKILAMLTAAETLGTDLILFPELALMGYPPRDVITRHPFLVRENVRWLRAIAAQTKQTWALVGFAEPRIPTEGEQRIGKSCFNSVALLGAGKIQAIIRKQLLPAYGELEDVRQFEAWPPAGPSCGLSDIPSPPDGVITVHGKRYGISICEDMWSDSEFFSHPTYGRDPIAALAAAKPDAIINLSASPSRSRKERLKHNLCSHLAQKYGIPYVYVNQVGTVDEVSFDGGSRVYDGHGRLTARARLFEEQCLIVNPFRGEGVVYPLPPGLEESFQSPKRFDPEDETDLGRTYQCLVQGIRDYFRKNGFQRAVLGLSGGLDSSVTVVLLADALGPKNVLGISMPSRLTPDENRSDARQLADNLGILLLETPISDMVEASAMAARQVFTPLEAQWGPSDPQSNASENVQAIARATLLRQVGNAYRALPVATSDKSEFYLGYATVNGDMSGALAPLGDVPKTKVRALARWLNKHRPGPRPGPGPDPGPVIPEAVILKPSGADLKRDPATGRLVGAEEELMPYTFADEVIWRLETLHQSMADMQEARFWHEERHGLEPTIKAEWLQKFFSRMARAVFKWFIAPPILIVEGNGSIAKSDYRHPITANRIVWSGHSDEAIQHFLESRALPHCDRIQPGPTAPGPAEAVHQGCEATGRGN